MRRILDRRSLCPDGGPLHQRGVPAGLRPAGGHQPERTGPRLRGHQRPERDDPSELRELQQVLRHRHPGAGGGGAPERDHPTRLPQHRHP